MKLFDKKFVYFMWDDTLFGKRVFVADHISNLKEKVDNGDSNSVEVIESDRTDYPFRASANNDKDYAFVYYDPLYDYKVAYSKSAKVVYRKKGSDGLWECVINPTWNAEKYEYKIVPISVIATNREVAKWLAEGNGMAMHSEGTVTINIVFDITNIDEPCKYKVCKWEDRYWHDATHEYLGIDVLYNEKFD
jgi:hypothetical protein